MVEPRESRGPHPARASELTTVICVVPTGTEGAVTIADRGAEVSRGIRAVKNQVMFPQQTTARKPRAE